MSRAILFTNVQDTFKHIKKITRSKQTFGEISINFAANKFFNRRNNFARQSRILKWKCRHCNYLLLINLLYLHQLYHASSNFLVIFFFIAQQASNGGIFSRNLTRINNNMEKSTVERITALRFDIIDTFHLVIFRFLVFRFETLSVRTLSPGRIDIRARMRGFELRPLLSRDYRRKRGTTESISLTQTFRDRRRRRRRRRQSVAHPTPPSTPHSPPLLEGRPSMRPHSNSRTNHWTPNCPFPRGTCIETFLEALPTKPLPLRIETIIFDGNDEKLGVRKL